MSKAKADYSSVFAALAGMASPEVMQRALVRAGAADEETLVILLAKLMNQHVVLNEGEEAKLRGIKKSETLAGYKRDGLIPKIL